MSGQTDNFAALLQPFGLTTEESQIYLYVLEKGTSTALKVSREVHIARTKVYRILDSLAEKQLIIRKPASTGTMFVASDPNQLEFLLSRRETELRALRESLPPLLETLHGKAGSGSSETKILYYRGIKGLSRVNWNLIHAKKEYLSYEVATAEAYMPAREAEELRAALVKRKITNRMITNQSHIKPFTHVSEMVHTCWQPRHIAKSVLTIKADIFIYNNVFAECHYLDDGDIFCFEMHNQHMADMQRALFENIWKQAEPMRLIGDRGEVVVG